MTSLSSMSSPCERSPVSPRPQARPYAEYVAQQQRVLAGCRTNVDKALADGPRIWQRMVIGFMCAGLVGLVMLVLGTVFMAEAVGMQEPITVMLCVMGIVCGVIILLGSLILGKLLISRKWIRSCSKRPTVPGDQCFHTCSVIYSPSLDHLATSDSVIDLPPAYDSVVSVVLHLPQTSPTASHPAHHLEEPNQTSFMILPPKYDEVTKPLPKYLDEFQATKF